MSRCLPVLLRLFRARGGFVASACLALLTTPAQGQLLQGTMDGNVTDSSQAAVAGARVVATDQATNFTRDTLTNSAGGYTLPTLPPGTYTVTVSASGFQSYTQTGIAVTPDTIRHNARVESL